MAKNKVTPAAAVEPLVEGANPEEVKKLKEHLLKCQDVSSESPAMKAVLTSLDQVGGEATAAPKKSHKMLNAVGHVLRLLILDLPLMALFGLYISTILLHEVSIQYYFPQVELMKWDKKRQLKELTYYHRECSREDITTTNRTDLMIPETMEPTDCMNHMLHHGVSIYSNLVSDDTAREARAYILDRNTKEEGWYVIENEKRYSFGVNVNAHPSIQKALKEIGSNKQLTEGLRKIVGPNPSVVEFTGITSQYGAADQHMHQDVVPRASAFKYARNFVPTYSLFVPLQDITAEMGSTEICPGTHQCADGLAEKVCADGAGMLVSGGTGSVWKSGSGALLNQQLFHRGTAHVDKNGPDRVLFILTFASRPRYGKNQVETRMIGHEGSYSLKWDQWGHTLDDFANAAKHMAQPWKTLRTLGLYKAPGRQWGWDFITVASMRLANEDTGFEPGKLKGWHKKGGFFFLPDFLKPPLAKSDTWQSYITKTILAAQEWSKTMSLKVVAGYLVAAALLNVVMVLLGSKRKGSVFLRTVGRLIVTHGLVLVIAYLVGQHIRSSQWARNIEHGKAYKSYRAPVQTELPGTLPYETDVLKDTRYQSSYLASYNKMLDINHPGNRLWLDLINRNSVDYHNLPEPVKKDLTKMVVFEMRTTNSGRILKQNEATKWTAMTEDEALTQAHVDLSKACDLDLDFLLTHLDYFRTELSAGVFRETALHKKHIPALLLSLQDKIIGTLPLGPKRVAGACHIGAVAFSSSIAGFAPQSKLKLPESFAAAEIRSIPTTMPPQLDVIPPYPSAWVQEGDVVDGQYKGEFNGTFSSYHSPAFFKCYCRSLYVLSTFPEWYRAVVVNTNANNAKIDVLYDDGDTDKRLCRLCIRPYAPLQIDEPVAIRVKNNFHDGRIVSDHGGERYDVETYTIGLQRNITSSDIRRFDYELGDGAVVEALFQGVGNIWYRGKIFSVNDDETFDVEYDDGDKEYGVEAHHIRLAA
jgi:hypothetical protein